MKRLFLLALLLLPSASWAGCDDPNDPRYCGQDWGDYYRQKQRQVEDQYRDKSEDRRRHDRR